MEFKPLSEKYRKSSEAIITYDWVDIINGLGYQTFYLATTYNTAISYILSPNVVYSNDDSVKNDATATFAFNSSALTSSRTIKGTAIFDIWAGAGGGGNWTCTGTLYYVRGGTPVSLGTFTAEATAATGGNLAKMTTIEVAETQLAIGDSLRLTITVGAGNDSSKSVWTNPAGVHVAAGSGTSSLHLPFKITE